MVVIVSVSVPGPALVHDLAYSNCPCTYGCYSLCLCSKSRSCLEVEMNIFIFAFDRIIAKPVSFLGHLLFLTM